MAANWQSTCTLTLARKEFRLLADLKLVPESKLLEMLARARSSAADKSATLECEWITRELHERERLAERQFGIDMVPTPGHST